MNIYQKIGKQLEAVFALRGYNTRVQVAELLGTNAPDASNICLGKCNFTISKLVKMADLVDCEIEVIIKPKKQ